MGYYLSTLPLLLGLIWVAVDPLSAPCRYAPTSALTYLLCIPVLLPVLAAAVAVLALAVDPGGLSTEIPDFR